MLSKCRILVTAAALSATLTWGESAWSQSDLARSDDLITQSLIAMSGRKFADGERYFKQAINNVRRSRDYYDERLYLGDALYHSAYGWYLLQYKDDVTAAERYNREAIRIAYDGAINHRRKAREQAENTETAMNLLGMVATTVAAVALQNEGYGDLAQEVATNFEWEEYEPDYSAIPSTERFTTRDKDIIRFPMFAAGGYAGSIGRVLNADGGYCSGALVGTKLVLTASHCVRPGVPREFRFETTFGHIPYGVTTYYNGNGERGSWRRKDWPNDWAVLVLDRPVEGRRPLDVRPRITNAYADSLDGNVAVAGFSGDLDDGRLMTLHWGCSIVGRSSDVLRHDCRMYKGASGTPIVDKRTGTILAVNAFTSADRPCVQLSECYGGGPTLANAARLIFQLNRIHR